MNPRLNAFSMLAQHPVVILDTKSTGIDTTAEIVEISLINLRGEVLLNSLVKPCRSIPLTATNMHGITNEKVENVPTWDQLWPSIQQCFVSHLVVIYNAAYDIRLMMQSSDAVGLQLPDKLGAVGFFCAMLEYSFWHGEHDIARAGDRRISLARACQLEGVETYSAHTALRDCQLTLAVIQSVTRKIAMIKMRGSQ